jgi:hypothetical protein
VSGPSRIAARATALVLLAVLATSCGSSDAGEGGKTLPSTPVSGEVTVTAPSIGTSPDGTPPEFERPSTTLSRPDPTAPDAPEAPPVTADTTLAPSTTGPASTVIVSTEEPAEDEATTTWWPWLLAAAVIIGIIVLLVRSRAEGASTKIELRTLRALDRALELSSRLASVLPEQAQAMAAQDAPALTAVAAELQATSGGSPGLPASQLDQVRSQILALHGVLEAVALAADPPSPAAVGHIREQATLLHTVTAHAHAQLRTGGN